MPEPSQKAVPQGGGKKGKILKESVQAEGDASLAHVIGRDLNPHAITHDKADEALAHLAGDVSQELMAVCYADAEHRSGQYGGDDTLHLDFAFTVVVCLLCSNGGRGGGTGASALVVAGGVVALLRTSAATVGGICHDVGWNSEGRTPARGARVVYCALHWFASAFSGSSGDFLKKIGKITKCD